MTKRLKRIAPVKFGIVLGIFYGLISLIFVPFFLLAIFIPSFAQTHEGAMQQGLSTGVGLVLCIFASHFLCGYRRSFWNAGRLVI
jgi:hypothetical protein